MTESLVMTMKEVYERLERKTALAVLYKMARRGDLPTVHCGRKILVPVARFQQWLDGTWTPPGKGQR